MTRRRESLPSSVPLTAVTLVAVALALTACAGASAPDLVIRHAKVFTNDTARPWAEAVAIKGERVVAVGDEAAIAALAGASTRVLDAGGRVLVPGFNDARVDLPLEPPTPQGLATLDREAVVRGVTSLQVVAGGPMRSLVVAAQQAERSARWRLIRAPMDGERPQDEEPYLPPQPGVRLVASGVSWTLDRWLDRQAGDAQLGTFVKWAYGAEDPLVVAMRGDLSEGGDGEAGGHAALDALLAAIGRQGVGEVWRRKRPRLDLYGKVPIDAGAGTPGHLSTGEAVSAVHARLAVAGLVVTVVPRTAEDRHHEKDIADFAEPWAYGEAGVPVALGSGRGRNLMTAIADVRDLGEVSREATIRAATWGSAYAEKAERDKGWLAPGTLADLAILSDDIFTVPADRLPSITSVLTLVGGTIVYDPGVLPSR
jgi:hypothetical protein